MTAKMPGEDVCRTPIVLHPVEDVKDINENNQTSVGVIEKVGESVYSH